jgi:NADH:ubiquinone oxidoreductase subunit 4 (subunit M)
MDQMFLVKFLVPLIWAISFIFAPKNNEKIVKILALIGSFVCLYYATTFYTNLPDAGHLTELFKFSLPHFFGINYTFAIDGLSSLLLILNSFLLLVVVIATWEMHTDKLRLY